jgi:hypothetical protein
MTEMNRRRLLAWSGAAVGVAAAGAGGLLTWTREAPITLPPPVSGLPPRQHAWEGALRRDQDGNAEAARAQRLLMFDVDGDPGQDHVRRLEAVLRRLEHAFPWSASGLVHLIGWGPGYFARYTDSRSPIPAPRPLSLHEDPELDDYDVCVHLACDDEKRLAMIEQALVDGGGPLAGASLLSLRGVLRHRETRTGFVGAGLPARHQDVSGIPAGRPVPSRAPLYMGFKSGFRRNQATEDEVTIDSGSLAGGTTMHVSALRLRLDSWYGLLDEDGRAARMFAPQVRAREVSRFTTSAPTHAGEAVSSAEREGVVGHLQAAAGARRADRPLILRRDFNTIDNDRAGLHFLALQRSIADFEATRRAMNAADVPATNPGITATVNNGIKEFIFVSRRANYVVPPRADRSFPLLPGRREALA